MSDLVERYKTAGEDERYRSCHQHSRGDRVHEPGMFIIKPSSKDEAVHGVSVKVKDSVSGVTTFRRVVLEVV